MQKTINLIISILCLISFNKGSSQSPDPNLIIITTDGLRWQEIFTGLDKNLATPDIRIPAGSREALMPFVWNTLVHHANLFGNRTMQNLVNTRNYHRFSYPGYSELFCGVFDPSVNSNGKVYNRNVSILEDLNHHPIYKNKISVFSSWEIFPYILNEPRSGLMVNAGWEPIVTGLITPAISRLNDALINPPINKGETRSDDLTWRMAIEYAKANHPKVLYISLNDTDDYGHFGNYPAYAKAINQFDTYLSEMWKLIQLDPFYKNNTYLMVTTDHGRGSKSSSWRNHGFLPLRSGEIWYMEYGPTIQQRGECTEAMQQYQVSLSYKMADVLQCSFSAHQAPILPELNPEILMALSRGIDSK